MLKIMAGFSKAFLSSYQTEEGHAKKCNLESKVILAVTILKKACRMKKDSRLWRLGTEIESVSVIICSYKI
jgi:hypothetical protein